MKEASGSIRDKAKEQFIIQQEVDTKGTGKMIKSKVKVFFSKTKELLKLLILDLHNFRVFGLRLNINKINKEILLWNKSLYQLLFGIVHKLICIWHLTLCFVIQNSVHRLIW